MLKHLIAAVIVAGALTACIFDKDDKEIQNRKLTLSGTLAEIDSTAQVTPDTAGATYDSWFLLVDVEELEANQMGSPNCFYTGYLGDSTQATYTNELMSGEPASEAIRQEGVSLYRDTSELEYSHYQVVFECLASTTE